MELDSQLKERLKHLVQRLKLIQADLIDCKPAARAQIFEDEIKRILNEVPNSHVTEFLRQLAIYFPTIEQLDLKVETAVVEKSLDDYSTVELVKSLKSKMRNMESAEKQALLSDLGVAPSPAVDLASTNSGDANASASPESLVIIDTLDVINTQLWAVVKKLSSHATEKSLSSSKRCDMESVRHSIMNQANKENIEIELLKLKKLFGILIHAVDNFSEAFYDEYMKPLEPSCIAASIQKTGFMQAKEVKMWEKYCHLAQVLLSREAFQASVTSSIGNTINNIKW